MMFAGRLPLAAMSCEVVNFFAANKYFAASLQQPYGSFAAKDPFHKGVLDQSDKRISINVMTVVIISFPFQAILTDDVFRHQCK